MLFDDRTKVMKEYKNKLEEKKKELENKIAELKQIPEFGDDVDSLEEETNESQEYVNQLSKLQEYKERFLKVERALEKISNGNYGKCEECNKEIEEEVLEVAPESRRCKECKLLPNN